MAASRATGVVDLGAGSTVGGVPIGGGATPDLASVLAEGNATGANDIIITDGQSILGEVDLFISAGDVVDADGNSLELRASDGNGVDRDGGDITLGVGAKTGAGVDGQLQVELGASGARLLTYLNAAGAVEISVAQPVTADTSGFRLEIYAGAAVGNGDGGNLDLWAGAIDTAGAGGSIRMWATPGSSGFNGGSVLGWAGYGGVGGQPGRIEFIGGEGDDLAPGGPAILRGGPGNAPGATGGQARIFGGAAADADSSSGGIVISTPDGGATTGSSGDITVSTGGTTDGGTGSYSLVTGDAGGTNGSGSISLTTGGGYGTGNINITAAIPGPGGGGGISIFAGSDAVIWGETTVTLAHTNGGSPVDSLVLDATGLAIDTTGIGFFGTAPIAQETPTGSRGGNAALASLLTTLANYGLIVDGTSA